ncbi:hypothetical protein N7532_005656 [Penicillium argentinense]|uniref:Uncharacterized protein n=1 Tax=Penicillium argentinense TaxID=1131581 RepID=A0A9W9KA59_9EURO|nr:uncharacterized protein N7532_005656 [Penicillium argentinense]KAJ5098655.1 hypothetical protein N7532_005656 [Penicillium argentinense]
MQSGNVGVVNTTSAPIQAFSKNRASARVAYMKTALSTHNHRQYIELDDFHAPTSPVQRRNRHAVRKKRLYNFYFPDTFWTRSFAVVGIVETLFTVGIESWIIFSISKEFSNDKTSDGILRLRSFLGLYIFALFYELALSYDALRRKNTFQLTGLCICNFGLFLYGGIQMKEIHETISNLSGTARSGSRLWRTYLIELILVPVFLGVCTVIMAFVTWKLRAEFSWTIYKSINADLQMSRRYFTYQVFIALLKFDFFFVFGTQLQILLAMNDFTANEFIIQAAMIPLAILSLTLGARFCRLEKRKSLICIMFLILVVIASFVNTLFQIYGPSNQAGLKSFKFSLTLFSILAILLLTVTLVNAILCIVNFKKGLKEHIDISRRKKPAAHAEDSWAGDNKSRFVLN